MCIRDRVIGRFLTDIEGPHSTDSDVRASILQAVARDLDVDRGNDIYALHALTPSES